MYGKKVDYPIFPFHIYAKPTKEVNYLFSPEAPEPWDELKWLKDLESTPSD